MKIGIYDPYLDTLGGGERYILSIADFLQNEHEVIIFWNDANIKEKIKERFLINLKNVTVQESFFSEDVSTIRRAKESYGLDYLFYISDGSVPLILAKQVVPIVQYPIKNLRVKDIKTRLKFINTKFILCYSEFVKNYIENIYPVPIRVLYPPVPQFTGSEKREKIILSVGRFTTGKNAKKQDFMINFFLGHRIHFNGWKLVLAGAVLPQDKGYIEGLKERIHKAPIEIQENITYAQLARLYAKAKIYWHAAGYGEDLVHHPELAEHFGISVVEAMSAGCVPVVYEGGGLKEIVNNEKDGFLWLNDNELFQKTKLLTGDNWLWDKLSKNAVERAKDFSKDRFYENLKELIKT